MKGIIDLTGYLSKSSYGRIKEQFYLYDKLVTYNFDEFKELQLESFYGKPSYYEMIQLLVDQGLIELVNLKTLTLEENEDTKQILSILDEVHNDYLKANKEFDLIKEPGNRKIIHERIISASGNIIALKERLFSQLLKGPLKEELYPTLSINSYGDILKLPSGKADIYRILIKNLPIPADDVPLVDILQYKNEESNKLRFNRLKSWVNKFSKTKDLKETEIDDEINTLIMEYHNEMKIAGMKIKLSTMECIVKILPSMVENLLKLNFSKMADPIFKLSADRIALLHTENKAKGNELSYIIKANR